MFEKPCACGKTNKNFKIDIGPFFVNDCCLEAGYDELGQKILTDEEKAEAAALAIKDEGEQPDPADEIARKDAEEAAAEAIKAKDKAEKKAAKDAEKAAKKAQKDAEAAAKAEAEKATTENAGN